MAGGQERDPKGVLAIRTVAMPADANAAGDIFGGWVLAQMDIAGGVTAHQRARGRVATVAVDAMTFHRPVMIGDLVELHADIIRIGRTSIGVRVETWAVRAAGTARVLVTEGTFTYVALGPDRRPRPVDPPPVEA